MSLFACAIGTDGARVPESFRADIESSPYARDRELVWHLARSFVGVVDVSSGGAAPSIVRMGAAVAVGVVRLDNRHDVAAWCSSPANEEDDLALALRYLARDDGRRIGRLLGDFAIVTWDPTTRFLLAARDALGVRKLYHASGPQGIVRFASRAGLLGSTDHFDVQYLAERVAQRSHTPTRTVFAGVSALPPATALQIRAGAATTATYWSVRDAVAAGDAPTSPAMLVDAFRELFLEAVRGRLRDVAPVWSQLSGGMDSSSVVSSAQWLAARGSVPLGLGGTISYVDDLRTGADEREFSDLVVRRWGVRNELVPHRQDVRAIMDRPPLLDQPDLPYAVAVRDRAAGEIVAGAGGRVLLTGEGGDALTAGTMFFFADWMVSGQAWAAVREMAHRAALGRVSFWKLAYENVCLPLMPATLRHALTRGRGEGIPCWIPRAVARGLRHQSDAVEDRVYGGRLRHKYADTVAATIDSIPDSMPLGPIDDLVERRHPFLHRPLVELALRLPPEVCVRPHARKWILREAMRGILPEGVRTRVGKAGLEGIHAWSLAHDRQRLDWLLRDPILAQLGCIEPRALRAVIESTRHGASGRVGWTAAINRTLEMEMWLQLRSGRWAADESQRTCTTSVESAGIHHHSTGQCPGVSHEDLHHPRARRRRQCRQPHTGPD